LGTLIDSSVLIAAERASARLEQLLGGHEDEEIAMAAITASELLHGVHRATRQGVRAKRAAFVESVLEVVPVIVFDLVAARIHATIWADLAARGINVGAHDLLIGATALSVGFGVATRDRRSFPKIPGLTIRDW
jgi:tRNA(fMet)-specific endonuclease VapC